MKTRNFIHDECSFEVFMHEDEFPERFKGLLRPGEMLLKARSLTTDFLPPKWLRELGKDSQNQRVLWRHFDPENQKHPGRVYGRILETEINKFECPQTKEEKEAIDTWYRIFGDLPIEKKLQEYIKKKHERGEQIGISKAYILNSNKANKEITRVFSLEDSITYKPECKVCTTQKVIQLEEKEDEDINMPKDPQDKEAKEIEKLQEELDDAKLQLEKRDEKLAELEKKVKEFEEEIEEKEDQKVTLEDKVIELKDEISKMEQKVILLDKKPLLEKVEKLEKQLHQYDEAIFEFEKSKKKDWLNDRIKKLEKLVEESQAQIVTKTLEDERDEIEKNEEEKDVGTENAFRNNPELMKVIKKLQKEGEI